MLNIDSYNLERTKNNFGYQHSNSEISKAFIDFAAHASHSVVDIGAAYGIAVHPCLNKGARVIAVDICFEHLEELRSRTPKKNLNKLTIIQARFPDNLQIEENSVSGILLSHVLSFLTPLEVLKGIYLLHKWLVPGGKVFIINYSPYHKTMKDFVPHYIDRKKRGEEWPGFIENKWKYCKKKNPLSRGLPDQIHLFDDEILRKLFANNGFTIERADLFGGANQGVPEPFILNGQEWVGLIGTKPISQFGDELA